MCGNHFLYLSSEQTWRPCSDFFINKNDRLMLHIAYNRRRSRFFHRIFPSLLETGEFKSGGQVRWDKLWRHPLLCADLI